MMWCWWLSKKTCKTSATSETLMPSNSKPRRNGVHGACHAFTCTFVRTAAMLYAANVTPSASHRGFGHSLHISMPSEAIHCYNEVEERQRHKEPGQPHIAQYRPQTSLYYIQDTTGSARRGAPAALELFYHIFNFGVASTSEPPVNLVISAPLILPPLFSHTHTSVLTHLGASGAQTWQCCRTQAQNAGPVTAAEPTVGHCITGNAQAAAPVEKCARAAVGIRGTSNYKRDY